ncbi:hypothetical protein ABZW18_00440 [Streptomyces sp. NPDC004647]|uniref:hypothetical protein n=1 Tax=Streptomyces sp. NPDC004647 TaxID=3154671 RepID=UPI00339DD335
MPKVLMKNTRALSVRRIATALACAAVLMPLAACQGDADPAPAGDTNQASDDLGAGTRAQPNGVERLPAREIYEKGTQANADAGSFRERMTRKDAKTDIRISATECVGTVEKQRIGSFEIIRKGNDVWAKIDTKFAGFAKARGASLPAGKWIHGPQSNGLMRGLSSYCHHERFTAPDKASTKMTRGTVAQVDGHSAVPVTTKSEDRSLAFYVATTGKSNIVKQESTGVSKYGDIVFTEFGKPVGAKAPTGEVMEAPN